MDHPDISNEIVPLESLLKQLRTGEIRVPRFQRPFDWRQDQVEDLLMSVKNRYPIGSVLLWEAEPLYSWNSKIGPIQVEEQARKSVKYLLDGQQRMTSLLGALGASEVELLASTASRWRIHWELGPPAERTPQTFTPRFLSYVRKEEPRLFPLWKLLETEPFIDHCEWIRANATASSAEVSQWIRRAKELLDTFRKYQISTVVLKNSSLKEAVAIFGKLNSTGKRVSPDQLFSALAYDDKQESLADGITRILTDKLGPVGFGGFSRAAVMRCLLASLPPTPTEGNGGSEPKAQDVDLYTSDFGRLVELHGATLGRQLVVCGEALTSAARFLGEHLGIRSHRDLPYAFQMILLAEFFRLCPKPDGQQIDLLKRWVLSSSFRTAYASGNSLQFSIELKAARALAQGDPDPARRAMVGVTSEATPLPQNIHPRAARVRAFFLFLRSLDPRDLANGEPIDREAFSQGGLQSALPVLKDSTRRDRLANRLMLGPRGSRDPQRDLINLKGWLPERRKLVLESHAIPEKAWRALVDRREDEFVALRETCLVDREREFMERNGIAVPHERIVADVIADLSDEEADE